MKKKIKAPSNYDKRPFVKVAGYGDASCQRGWNDIAEELNTRYDRNVGKHILVVDCYLGVAIDNMLRNLKEVLSPDYVYCSSDCMKSSEAIDQMVYPDVTDDEVFGYLTRLQITDFFVPSHLEQVRKELDGIKSGLVLVLGIGAGLFVDADTLVYADMPRWEGQLRFRRGEADNLGVRNNGTKPSLQYKRAFFVDWRVCDRHKKKILKKWDYVLDTLDTNGHGGSAAGWIKAVC